MHYQEILDFWFKELTAKDWFAKSDALDQSIKDRFLAVHKAASRGELFTWRETAQGRLAEIIVLDQFSRNIFRNTKEAFAYDSLALVLAQELVLLKLDQTLSDSERSFAYLPYMHSESKTIHQQALALYTELGNGRSLEFEIAHKAIIDRFGRYPHRNAQLGRISSDEEEAFLLEHAGF
ncbi:DUF924 family protein [Cysteiniphilum sp. JM-1]|uniref:DUF924 family protein n=1 Tax=Cysteiniphilum TaxID=2056696 RepID=UPI001243BD98|nr:DUF924 family protein [Cysteiniphilum sp. JM-1]